MPATMVVVLPTGSLRTVMGFLVWMSASLLFYVKNYISTHGKELGILKALGYSNIKIARHFWVFGLSVFVGCAVGFVMGYLYLPTFYQKQAPNLQTLIPALKVQFHPLLTFALVGAPTIAFAVISPPKCVSIE